MADYEILRNKTALKMQPKCVYKQFNREQQVVAQNYSRAGRAIYFVYVEEYIFQIASVMSGDSL